MCLDLSDHLTSFQRSEATIIIDGYLKNSTDWIVQNTSLKTLGVWAQVDSKVRSVLSTHLIKFQKSDKKSVASNAKKIANSLEQ